MWNEHILMINGDNMMWCLCCGKRAHRYSSHLRSRVCLGALTPNTSTRHKYLCLGRHPLAPHDFIGESKPLRLAAWPQWCRREEVALAVEMPASRVAPLLEERAQEIIEVLSDDSDVEALAETVLLE